MMAEGYRPGRERHHERAILSLRETVGVEAKQVMLLDAVRRKRNQINYEHAGSTSASEADQFYDIVQQLRTDVVRWLKKNHSGLCPPGLKA
ncbi:MAG: hypothetical protein AB1762_10860 [Gemmatimonadota bacterium]